MKHPHTSREQLTKLLRDNPDDIMAIYGVLCSLCSAVELRTRLKATALQQVKSNAKKSAKGVWKRYYDADDSVAASCLLLFEQLGLIKAAE